MERFRREQKLFGLELLYFFLLAFSRFFDHKLLEHPVPFSFMEHYGTAVGLTLIYLLFLFGVMGAALWLERKRGETGSVCMTAESAVKQGVDLIVISSAPESTLGKIHAPDIEIEAATKFATSKVSVQPLGSLFEQMLLMVFDTIILEMSEEKEGSNEDMAKRHASLE